MIMAMQEEIQSYLTKPIKLASGFTVNGRSSYVISGNMRCKGFPIPGSDKNIHEMFKRLGFHVSLTLAGEPVVHNPL
jgi:hypothetical protein